VRAASVAASAAIAAAAAAGPAREERRSEAPAGFSSSSAGRSRERPRAEPFRSSSRLGDAGFFAEPPRPFLPDMSDGAKGERERGEA